MGKCSICGTEQKQIGNISFGLEGSENKITVEQYNIQLLTYIKNKHICDNCMDTYYKIFSLFHDEDFSVGGNNYYADGRNLL